MRTRKSRKIHVSGRKRILSTIQAMESLHLWSAMVFLSYSKQFHSNSHHFILGRTKLALYLWTSELQRRLSAEGSNILVICANPGTVLTGMFDQHFSGVISSHLRFRKSCQFDKEKLALAHLFLARNAFSPFICFNNCWSR